jgi:hypothetical protein
VAERPSGALEPPPPGYVDLYELAVEMADRISARRGVANSFFLTINTGLAALLGGSDLRWYVAVAGIVICVSWWALLKSYRDLNAAKFGVILAMEARLPAQIFGDEWERLKRNAAPATPRAGARLLQYRELGRIERIVPWVFALIYVAEFVRQVVG